MRHSTIGTLDNRFPSNGHSSTTSEMAAEIDRLPLSSMRLSTGKSSKHEKVDAPLLALQPLTTGKQSPWTRAPPALMNRTRSPLYSSSKSVGWTLKLSLHWEARSVLGSKTWSVVLASHPGSLHVIEPSTRRASLSKVAAARSSGGAKPPAQVLFPPSEVASSFQLSKKSADFGILRKEACRCCRAELTEEEEDEDEEDEEEEEL
mmetsp:Transcript_72496/g.158216  ORF Transcript_72496/g.158216 Transcript_72496/m.158216 type:complete len:205 (+) Transcript_72496:657-1271(+)